ncbi:S8 family serine peptidase [Halalkalibacillus halophilus]|uniref:S8 family serine peptidase n=1 Tax=Halalkalibacillus halophilus TaxID=392827 RepID=UPI000429F1FE|nr:S8 family serine peptidase [Halalkalibacillus halophilus]
MKKKFTKFGLILLAVMLTFTTMGFSQQSSGDLQRLATIEGEYNYDSSEIVSVIVELESPSLVEAKHTGQSQSQGDLQSKREQIMNEVETKAPSSDFQFEYDYVFSGFSVEVRQDELRGLAAVSGVKAIYPDKEYTATEMESIFVDDNEVSPNMMDSAPYIGAQQVWEDLGVTGEGVTVAVIDTGVDYTHPDLEHAFGDYKGYDFVDFDEDPQETPEGDPRGDSTTHGSHVAGTIAANGLIKGVAPNADLLAYRVLGPGGSGSTNAVLAGIEQAVLDGADVMNLSLGNTSNDPDFATSIALDWATAEGVVAVGANGNAGPDEWTIGAPGTSRDAISVGATQLPHFVFDGNLTLSNGETYSGVNVMGFPSEEALNALNGQTYEYEHVGLGSAEDFANVDVDGKVALIQRGEYPFVEKAENAQAAGAVGAIIYNNVEGTQPDVPGMAVPTFKMSLAQGQELVSALENGENEITFSLNEPTLVEETIADFSSRGPVTETWMIKPDVSAPGVAIVSTIPNHATGGHAYASLQGTSMAAPHVAGAAALLLEQNPDWEPQRVKSALMNTAESISDRDGNTYPFNAQGAGSIRVVDALTTETLVNPGSYSFGTFEKENGKQVERQHFEIENLSNERKRFNMDVEFFDGENHIKVNTSKNLNVKGNGSQKVNMNVQVDAGKLEPGYYEGLITLTHGDEVIEVPTILFVQDPYEVFDIEDLLDSGSFTLTEDGVFQVELNLNKDVDYVDLVVYTADLAPVAVLELFDNLPEGQNNLEVDGKWLLDQLPAGDYALVSWVGKEGYEEEGWVLGEFTLE